MKFLVPNYSCLQNPWLWGYRLHIPVLSVLNWICWTPPPEQNFWIRHWLGILVCCVFLGWGLLRSIYVSSVAISAVLYHCLVTNQYLAKIVSCQHSHTQTPTDTLAHKRGDFSSRHRRELTFALELFCSSDFDKWMKDGAARHLEGGYNQRGRLQW